MVEADDLRKLLDTPADRVFVPIGVNCSTANFLRSASLRSVALPFDWNITPIQSAIELVENRFDRFFDFDTITLLPPVERKLFREEDGHNLVKSNELVTPAYCHKYSMFFPHDLADGSTSELARAQLKYRRRAQSLLSLLASAPKLIFVVTEDRLTEWQLAQIGLANGKFPERPVDWEKALQKALPQKGKAVICSLQSLKTAWHLRCSKN